MYKIGEQFKLNINSKAKDENIIKGQKFRITILSELLIRFEYNENGIFEDRATEMVINRNLDKVNFEKVTMDNTIYISTRYFKLVYKLESPFTSNKMFSNSMLKVDILGTNKTWFFGMPEIRNYGSPTTELVSENGKLKKSLYSLDGFTTIDDSKSNVYDDEGVLIPREQQEIDLYLFAYGKDFSSCLVDYYKLTGFPNLIPRYALGNWWYRNYGYNDTELRKLINKFYDNEIPLSIVVLNKDWHLNPNKDINSGFTADKTKFENFKSTIDYLHSMGIRMGLSINPFNGFYPIEENYEELKKYLPEDKNGKIPFDVLNPRFLDVYLKLIIHKLDSYGVDFYWLDYFDKKNLKVLNTLKHYQFYDMMRDYRRRPLLLAPNTLVASHRYPVLYSGKTKVSWNTLKAIAFHNINSTNVGISWWSHDIGGYYEGIEDNELYIRYVQLGTFSPILKFGADSSKYYKREPWRWGIKAYQITKDYLQLRHKLIPYLYSEAYSNSKFGIPLITPLYYSTPNMYDDPLYKTEYYFGSQLFISPITTSKDYIMNRVIHKFFIPHGIWYDFVTGKKFVGNKKYVSFFKDNDYPVFARQGAIIPLGTNKNINDTNPPTDMEIHIFPGKSNTYKLYEDDGVSNLYKKDYYLMTMIDYNYMPNNYTLIIRALEGKSGIIPEFRNYKIRFRNTKKADDVIVYLDKDKINYNSYTENDDFIVVIKNVVTIGKQLTINCKGKDIEADPIRIMNDDIEDIVSDLPIETIKKDKIDEILFGNLTIKKKRIAIRKLSHIGIDRKFIQLFLKLLEYVEQI